MHHPPPPLPFHSLPPLLPCLHVRPRTPRGRPAIAGRKRLYKLTTTGERARCAARRRPSTGPSAAGSAARGRRVAWTGGRRERGGAAQSSSDVGWGHPHVRCAAAPEPPPHPPNIPARRASSPSAAGCRTPRGYRFSRFVIPSLPFRPAAPSREESLDWAGRGEGEGGRAVCSDAAHEAKAVRCKALVVAAEAPQRSHHVW